MARIGNLRRRSFRLPRSKPVVESVNEAPVAEAVAAARTFTGRASLIGSAKMDEVSANALVAARRLWSGERLDAASSPDVLAAGLHRLAGSLRGGLSRWIGSEGYVALLKRALEIAGAQNAGNRTGGLHFLTEGEAAMAAAVRLNGVANVVREFISVVAALIHLLGEVVGEEMAIRLVEQAWASNPRGGSGSDSQGVRNG